MNGRSGRKPRYYVFVETNPESGIAIPCRNKHDAGVLIRQLKRGFTLTETEGAPSPLSEFKPNLDVRLLDEEGRLVEP